MKKDDLTNGFGANVENFKRRRALPPTTKVSEDVKFFERILNMRRAEHLVFITKTVARNR